MGSGKEGRVCGCPADRSMQGDSVSRAITSRDERARTVLRRVVSWRPSSGAQERPQRCKLRLSRALSAAGQWASLTLQGLLTALVRAVVASSRRARTEGGGEERETSKGSEQSQQRARAARHDRAQEGKKRGKQAGNSGEDLSHSSSQNNHRNALCDSLKESHMNEIQLSARSFLSGMVEMDRLPLRTPAACV